MIASTWNQDYFVDYESEFELICTVGTVLLPLS